MHIIRKCWALADICYRDRHVKNKPPERMELALTLLRGSDYCEIWEGQDDVIIAYRGSDDWKDWINNAWIGFCRYHIGMKRQADLFWPEIAEFAKSRIYKQFILTGYSRGGALATYTAEKLDMIIKGISCVTFGCPPPAKKSYRNYYNKLAIDHTNIYIGWDIIYTLKMAYLLGLRHVGKSKRIEKPFYWRFPPFRTKAHFRSTIDKEVKNRW